MARLGLLIAGTALSNSSQASLTAETVNGINVVYDNVTNTTWTADANLFSTMEANAVNQYGNDNNLITAIINANGGVIHDTPNMYDNYTGNYKLSSSDFFVEGNADWWGAQAFIGYLNSINYDNSSEWVLPTISQLNELLNYELGGNVAEGIPVPFNSTYFNYFSNIQNYWAIYGQMSYWSSTEYQPYNTSPYMAYSISFWNNQSSFNSKTSDSYFWAVSPGNIAAPVPVPAAIWLFGSCLGLLNLSYQRRRVIQLA